MIFAIDVEMLIAGRPDMGYPRRERYLYFAEYLESECSYRVFEGVEVALMPGEVGELAVVLHQEIELTAREGLRATLEGRGIYLSGVPRVAGHKPSHTSVATFSSISLRSGNAGTSVE